MLRIRNAVMRLLLGASFILNMLLASDFSDTTFLFCLKVEDKPLIIQRDNNFFKVDNIVLDRVLHDIGVIDLEEWIPSALENDSYNGIYLNRIYRAYTKEGDVRSIMESLNSSYSLLYVERENIHKLHYQPDDPNYEQQCSMPSVKADKAWDFWGMSSGFVPSGENVLLASVDTGVDYSHPDLQNNAWINQGEIPSWTFEAGLDKSLYISINFLISCL